MPGSMSMQAATSRFDADSPKEVAALDLVLYPNPPLGPHGTTWVLGTAAAVLGVVGLGFWVIGAWPVTGFLGLDLLALWLALRVASKRARRSETIRLDRGVLTVRRHGPDGSLQGETVLDPTWVQVVLDERRRHDPLLALRSHGRLVPVGRFLAPDERRELAHAIREGLDRHRAPLSR
jgi:uncharacterized membrane protein